MEIAQTLIGKKVGRYEIVEYLGSGAMAHVYKGFHQTLERYVAVKVLHPEFASDDEFVGMFQREARSLASLAHPNIVQVYDFDIESGVIYMVMEYIEGITLKDEIDERRRLNDKMSVGYIVKLIKYVAIALSYAHRKNIIHRDVKPGNIMLEKSGRVVLADFGFAKLLTGNTDKVTGMLRGTPAYMSPEQGMGNPVRGSTDIYALGVIFYELMTGQLPFSAENPLAITVKHIKDEVPDPHTIDKRVSKRIEKIIMKSLEKNTKDRYGTVDLLLKDIDKLKESKSEHLPTASLSLAAQIPVKSATAAVTDLRLILHFMGSGQILELPPGTDFTLGRIDKKSTIVPDVDLTPYKGHEWGISRMHAKLIVRGTTIQIVDLDSTNGTWIGGEILSPNMPFQLHHSDMLSLGKMKLQVLIYENPNK